jgi:hypothetical protein
MAYFVWTRMQDEAGQTLHTIIRRKEAERASGNGEFWWGIGNSLGACVLSAAREAGGSLPVLFSMMLSRPAKADSHAETVWLFDEWRDRNGHLHDMPPHVVCLSRSSSRRYALVCRSASPLTMSDHGAFSPPSKIRSTTALVQGDLDGEQHFPGHYHWGFRAELVEPWFVEMARPRELSREQRELLAGRSGFSDWSKIVGCLRP